LDEKLNRFHVKFLDWYDNHEYGIEEVRTRMEEQEKELDEFRTRLGRAEQLVHMLANPAPGEFINIFAGCRSDF
jgi:hypothetical protein